MARQVKAGSTDVSVNLFIADSTDGTPETGVVFNTAGIDLWYRREGAALTSITEVTLAALTTAHTDGGFLHIANGVYRLDLPDAAVASGVAGVQVGGTVTGMVVYGPYIELPVNIEADTYGRIGAPAGASASADIAAIKAETATILSDTNDIQTRLPAALVSGRIDASVGAMAADVLTAAATAADFTTEIQTGLASQASVNTIDDFLDTEVAAIKAKTDQMVFTTANQLDSRVLTNSDKTGYSVAASGIGAGAHAAAELNAIADAVLDRNMATGTDSGTNSTVTRTTRQALRALRNKVGVAAGTMTVTKEDDVTTSWTAGVTTTAGNPLSELDPT